MFDAKKLLDAMVAGTSPAAAPGQGGLGDLLGQMLRPGTAQVAPGAQPAGQGDLGGMLGDLLGKVKDAAGQAGGTLGQSGNPAGDLANMARDIFGNATSGVGDAARDLEQKTGAGGQLNDLIRQMSGGQGAGDLLARAQELVKNNPAAAGALAGALGTLVLGTRSGRGLAMDAAKLGGLVLIGGLAYKAFRNYQAGQSSATSASGAPQPAPAGSGFDAAGQGNDHAVTYLRAMIAAATADGQIDAGERQRIVGSLQQIGLDASAQAFLEQEFARPASVGELAAGATSPEVAAQIYSAARVAIEPESPMEQRFLAELAGALALDPALVAHIDAAASSVKG